MTFQKPRNKPPRLSRKYRYRSNQHKLPYLLQKPLSTFQLCISNASFKSQEIRAYLAWGLAHSDRIIVQSSGELQLDTALGEAKTTRYIAELEHQSTTDKNEEHKKIIQDAKKSTRKLEANVLETVYKFFGDYKKKLGFEISRCQMLIKQTEETLAHADLNGQRILNTRLERLQLILKKLNSKERLIVRDNWYQEYERLSEVKIKKKLVSDFNFYGPGLPDVSGALQFIPSLSSLELKELTELKQESKSANEKWVTILAWTSSANQDDLEFKAEVKKIENELTLPNENNLHQLALIKSFNKGLVFLSKERMRGDFKASQKQQRNMPLRSDKDLLVLLRKSLEQDSNQKAVSILLKKEILTTEEREEIINYLMTLSSPISFDIYKIHETATRSMLIKEFAMMRLTQKYKHPGYPMTIAALNRTHNPREHLHTKPACAAVFEIVHNLLTLSDPEYQVYNKYIDLSSIAVDPKYYSDPMHALFEPLSEALDSLQSSLILPENCREPLISLINNENIKGKINGQPYPVFIQNLSIEHTKMAYKLYRRYAEFSPFIDVKKNRRHVKIILEEIFNRVNALQEQAVNFKDQSSKKTKTVYLQFSNLFSAFSAFSALVAMYFFY